MIQLLLLACLTAQDLEESPWGVAPRYTIPEGTEWAALSSTIDAPQFVGKRGFYFGLVSPQHTACSLRRVTVSKEGMQTAC